MAQREAVVSLVAPPDASWVVAIVEQELGKMIAPADGFDFRVVGLVEEDADVALSNPDEDCAVYGVGIDRHHRVWSCKLEHFCRVPPPPSAFEGHDLNKRTCSRRKGVRCRRCACDATEVPACGGDHNCPRAPSPDVVKICRYYAADAVGCRSPAVRPDRLTGGGHDWTAGTHWAS